MLEIFRRYKYKLSDVIKYIQKNYKEIYTFNDKNEVTCISFDLKDYTFEIKSRFMTIMSSNENISEYLSDVYGELNYICENINTTMEFESLDDDMEMLAQFLTDLFINYSTNSNKFKNVIG